MNRLSREQLQGLLLLCREEKFQEALQQGEKLADQFPKSGFLLNLLGMIHFRLGQPERAVDVYARALRVNPDSAQAHNNWGIALDHLGRRDEAILSYERALELDPGLAQAHTNLANALTRLGRLDEAVSRYGKALELDPANAQAHSNRAGALAGLGRFDEAIEDYRKAIEIDPDLADAHIGLGNAQYRVGRLEDAVDSYIEGIELAPDDAEAHNNLGRALRRLGRPGDALAWFSGALEIRPEFAAACFNLGLALDDLGKCEEALASFDRALRLKPDYPEAWNNRGLVLDFLGETGEAADSYARALELKPDYAEAHRNLTTVVQYRPDDPHIRMLRQQLARAGASDADRMHLNFALGKVYDDLGRYDEAFSFLAEGNRLRKQELAYDIARARMTYASIVATFADDMPVPEVPDDSEVRPSVVFVLGMPRSGTTLVEQILASHSQVYGAGELRFLERSVSAIDWRSEPLSSDKLKSVRDAYFAALEGIGASEPWITDKLPFNFWWIGFIFAAVPDARVVHVRRDARAICWSNFRRFFPSPRVGFASDLEDLAEYYRLYAGLMDFWHEKFPGRIYDLDYEMLTEHQEDETRRLLEYVGLDWEDACLDFHETKRAVRTLSASQVRRSLYRGSSDEWRRYAGHLGPLIERLEGL